MEHKNEVEGISSIEQAARSFFDKYKHQRSLFHNYLEMNPLGELLRRRRAAQPCDKFFDFKILSILVYSDKEIREDKRASVESKYNRIREKFNIKYNLGDQDLFDFGGFAFEAS